MLTALELKNNIVIGATDILEIRRWSDHICVPETQLCLFPYVNCIIGFLSQAALQIGKHFFVLFSQQYQLTCARQSVSQTYVGDYKFGRKGNCKLNLILVQGLHHSYQDLVFKGSKFTWNNKVPPLGITFEKHMNLHKKLL